MILLLLWPLPYEHIPACALKWNLHTFKLGVWHCSIDVRFQKVPKTMITYRRALRSAVLISLGLLALVLNPATAAAHSKLVSSMPASGAAVKAPETVELQFSGVVNAELSTIEVHDGKGTQIASGKPAYVGSGRNTLRVPVRAGEGAQHSVKWRVVFADGHALDGSYTFNVTSTSATTPSTSVAPTVIATTVPPQPEQHDDHASMGHAMDPAMDHTGHNTGSTILASSSTGDSSLVVLTMLGAFALFSAVSAGLLRRLQH